MTLDGILDLQNEIQRLNEKYCKLTNVKENHSIKEGLIIKINKYNKELKEFIARYNYEYDNFVLHLNNCIMYDIIENK